MNRRRSSTSKAVLKVVRTVFIWLLAAVWFSPVLWMLSTSLKSSAVSTTETVPRWIPAEITLENYRIITAPVAGRSLLDAMVNSVVAAVLSVVLTLVVAVPAAYALARLKFVGRNAVFWSYVAVLAFPGALFLIPHYLMMLRMGLMDSVWALVIPGLGGTFAVFLLRQYMLAIPGELEDAAWVDGCSRLRFLVAIVVPLVRPALIILGLITFLGSWNNFLWPLLVLNNPESFTLPLGLVRFAAGWGDPFRGIGPTMAGAFLTVLPTLIVFVFFHRYLMQGISFGSGVK